MPPPPPIHLIIRLPYNRPTEESTTLLDPLPVEWNPQKEKLLWDTLSRSRAEGTPLNWQSLSTQLEVPLPYLLFRAQARYEQDLKVLQEVKSAVVSSSTPKVDETKSPLTQLHERPPSSMLQRVLSPRTAEPTIVPPSAHRSTAPSRLSLHLNGSGPSRLQPFASTSTLTLHKPPLSAKLLSKPSSPRTALPTEEHSSGSSPSSDTSDSESEREAEERKKVEEENVGRRLKDLEKMMSSDALGFARPPSAKLGKGRESNGGRLPSSPLSKQKAATPVENARPASAHSRRESEDNSSARNSIPSIPSPGSDNSQTFVQAARPGPSSRKSTSRTPSIRYGPALERERQRSDQRNSSRESQGSSFSDISDTSVTASALEDALMSNIRGGGASRLSMFARSLGPRSSQFS